jgi:hypothetical protein
MNSVDLEKLAQLDRAATPGPWFVQLLDDEHAMSAVAVCTKAQSGAGGSMRERTWPLGDVVAACLLQQPRYVDPSRHEVG